MLFISLAGLLLRLCGFLLQRGVITRMTGRNILRDCLYSRLYRILHMTLHLGYLLFHCQQGYLTRQA